MTDESNVVVTPISTGGKRVAIEFHNDVNTGTITTPDGVCLAALSFDQDMSSGHAMHPELARSVGEGLIKAADYADERNATKGGK